MDRERESHSGSRPTGSCSFQRGEEHDNMEGVWPLDPVKRRSSVQSTQRTALLCPSATWTHCSVADRLLLVGGTGLMTPLEHTHTSLSDTVQQSECSGNHTHPHTHTHTHSQRVTQHRGWLPRCCESEKQEAEKGTRPQREEQNQTVTVSGTNGFLCADWGTKKPQRPKETKDGWILESGDVQML